MTARQHALTAARVRALLSYDPATGVFRWRESGRGRKDLAGTARRDGRRQIKVDGAFYPSTHLAWLYVTGTWPSLELQPINGVRGDDRFENLRLTTPTEKILRSKTRVDNVLGAKGVKPQAGTGRFVAFCCETYLGTFSSVREASAAYTRAASARLAGRL